MERIIAQVLSEYLQTSITNVGVIRGFNCTQIIIDDRQPDSVPACIDHLVTEMRTKHSTELGVATIMFIRG